MPKRTDIKSILIIGSGPIVIGQGCEFDYSGTQACRALRAEGYRVVLVNSNPATIMTDPDMADSTYIEPILPETIEKILVREKENGTPIDALLPTLGGQTGLNVGMACWDKGILQRHGVEMIGADREAIFKGEDRQVFKDLMIEIGLKVPLSRVVHTIEEGREWLEEIGLPLIIRPAFTLGGTGGGIAYNVEEFEDIVARGLDASPVTEVLIEQSVIGWKEFELEVIRDRADNAIIVCGIENVDPMGVHTGDSITVAPIQTLSDKEYQRMRDAALAIIRAVGVETGGSNIQFAVNPDDGEMVVVEMNPRVSRSSALASKATGFPIAKVAAKLAVGYTLDELPNDITRTTSAAFEPTIDYVVVKMPRWTFEKFPDADEVLTTQMKSVGEAMAIGRTFKEALQKAIRSMEVGRFGLGLDAHDRSLTTEARSHGEEEGWPIPEDKLRRKLAVPSQGRIYYVRYALKMGWSVERVHELTNIDPWFLEQISEIVDAEDNGMQRILSASTATFRAASDNTGSYDEVEKQYGEYGRRYGLDVAVRHMKQLGFSDRQIGPQTFGAGTFEDITSEQATQWMRSQRIGLGVSAAYKLVDTCAAEFEARTPYYYSTYEQPFEVLDPSPDAGGRAVRQDAGSVLSDGGSVRQDGAADLQDGTGNLQDGAGVLSNGAGNLQDGAGVLQDGTAGSQDGAGGLQDGASVLPNGGFVTDDEIRISDRPKVVIIGGGPNRIGQGIEFDYCCVHAAYAMRELGYESVMVNSNPETVSTDYDTSDLLFFEPLTHEDVLNVCERLNGQPFGQTHHGGTETRSPESEGKGKEPPSPTPSGVGSGGLVKGVIVQFGGQTPLNLAKGLEEAGVPILGTSVDAIHRAGSREQFRELIQQLGLKQPPNGIARTLDEAKAIAKDVGYPVLVRPSFVLGGRAMETVYDEAALDRYMTHALAAAGLTGIADAPILVDKFLDNATEVDVGLRGRLRRIRERAKRRRRRHGAHRRGRHSQRRQRLRPAAALALAGDRRRAQTPNPCPSPKR